MSARVHSSRSRAAAAGSSLGRPAENACWCVKPRRRCFLEDAFVCFAARALARCVINLEVLGRSAKVRGIHYANSQGRGSCAPRAQCSKRAADSAADRISC